jgi:hypothetical protein
MILNVGGTVVNIAALGALERLIFLLGEERHHHLACRDRRGQGQLSLDPQRGMRLRTRCAAWTTSAPLAVPD